MSNLEEIQLKYGNSENEIISFQTKSCAILGENGAGKSFLSKKIFELINPKPELITAQRSLIIDARSNLSDDDERLISTAFSYTSPNIGQRMTFVHWTNVIDKNNLIQDDFNTNLERLIREHKNEYSYVGQQVKETNNPKFAQIKTKADEIFEIWNKTFLNKIIKIDKDGKIKINSEYKIEGLSDGERSALYLILKCVYAPENSIIIVDEAETHLNSALLQDLWDKIENERPDCRFVYISHNIDFITSRRDCTKFWIQNFIFPDNWTISEIKEEEDLPPGLIERIIGTKKPKILFVEGEKGSLEHKLYQNIYPEFKVEPVESCENVINFTKILRNSDQKYKKDYFGLIDRDFRTDESVEKLKESKVFCLPVAQYENLFFRKEVVTYALEYSGDEEKDEKIKDLEEELLSKIKLSNFRKVYYKNKIQQSFNQTLSTFVVGEKYEYINDYQIINSEWLEIEGITDSNILLKYIKGNNDDKVVTDCAKSIEDGSDGKNWKRWEERVIRIFNTDKKEEFKKVFVDFMLEII